MRTRKILACMLCGIFAATGTPQLQTDSFRVQAAEESQELPEKEKNTENTEIIESTEDSGEEFSEKFLEESQEDITLHIGKFSTYQEYENAIASGRLSAANESSAAEVVETLPTYFDLRKLGLVSAVKNQKTTGTCWSFSAIASMETDLIRKHPWINLSEWHLAYYTYSQKFGFPIQNGGTLDDVFQQGGNFYMLSPMLTGWLGPVSESLFPFGDESVLDPDADWDTWKDVAEYHVSDASVLAYHVGGDTFQEQLDAVKQAVYQGHAVSMSYYNKTSCYHPETFGYYLGQDEKTGGNYHAVTIVGWDDQYSSENFNTDPGMNGAWLIKNSWGPDWGNDHGYFWISYADPGMAEFYYLETEPLQKHDQIYQHDDYGYWTAFSVGESDRVDYISNVFTAEKDTYLTSVMLCTPMPGEKYTIHIYENLIKDTNPSSGTATPATTGTLSTAGYHIVDLTTPVELTEGEKFAVVVRYSGSSGQHIACEAYTSNTVTAPNGAVTISENMLSEEMILRDFNPGESFYSANGRIWHDIYEEDPISSSYTMYDGTQISSYTRLGNICLRALTQDAGVILFSEQSDSLPVGEEITLSSPEQGNIYYSINSSEYMLYTEPFAMPDEDIIISAYVETEDKTYPISEKTYQVQEAMLSSVMYLQDGYASYLQFSEQAPHQYVAHCNTAPDVNQIGFLPMTTGTVTCDEVALYSGTETEFDITEQYKLTLHVSQDGMIDTDYIIYLQDVALGDVNADGTVNAQDAAEILVYAALTGAGEDPEQNADWLDLADYNQDGIINAEDGADILVYAASYGVGITEE
ncbi:MAG: hypothetical protein K2H29_07825 [Oscillospiraceae bacterium]|nr:hypothetical protein [Oscillospiraceae bacterium]